MTKGDITTCRAAVSDPNDSRVPAKLVPKGKAEGPARTTQVQSNEIDKGDGQPSLDENGDGDGDGRSKYESFDDMNLKDNLLRGIYSYGFEKPSAIQARAIIPVTTGRDVIAQAQSGSGKVQSVGHKGKRNVGTCTLSHLTTPIIDGNLYYCGAPAGSGLAAMHANFDALPDSRASAADLPSRAQLVNPFGNPYLRMHWRHAVLPG
jgi:hypothetical protein